MTLSGQRAVGQPDRLDLVGEGAVTVDAASTVPRWVFQAGWPGLGAPAGVEMVRTDEKASGESTEDLVKLVMMVAPDGLVGVQTGASRNTRDGKPVWIRPRRGVRGGAPAARG